MGAAVAGKLQWLPQNHMITCNLWVDRREINFAGIPSETAFACVSIPPGKFQIPLDNSPNVAQLLSRPQYTQQECQQVEGWLRMVCHQRQASR